MSWRGAGLAQLKGYPCLLVVFKKGTLKCKGQQSLDRGWCFHDSHCWKGGGGGGGGGGSSSTLKFQDSYFTAQRRY